MYTHIHAYIYTWRQGEPRGPEPGHDGVGPVDAHGHAFHVVAAEEAGDCVYTYIYIGINTSTHIYINIHTHTHTHTP